MLCSSFLCCVLLESKAKERRCMLRAIQTKPKEGDDGSLFRRFKMRLQKRSFLPSLTLSTLVSCGTGNESTYKFYGIFHFKACATKPTWRGCRVKRTVHRAVRTVAKQIDRKEARRNTAALYISCTTKQQQLIITEATQSPSYYRYCWLQLNSEIDSSRLA